MLNILKLRRERKARINLVMLEQNIINRIMVLLEVHEKLMSRADSGTLDWIIERIVDEIKKLEK